MEPILLFGASGHASVVIDIVEKQGQWAIAGLVDSTVPGGHRVLGYEVFGKDGSLSAIIARTGAVSGIVAIGDNFVRGRVAEEILAAIPDFRFVTGVHPSAQLARGTSIGVGSVVMAGAIINSRSRVGEHCIVNTKASIDHDCEMEDFSSIGPNGTLGGNVRVGRFSHIGQSATVIQKKSVGEHSIAGAGAVVLCDIPARVIAHGVPARVSRTRKDGEPYV